MGKIKNMAGILCGIIITFVIVSNNVNADRGMVSVHGVSIYEPGQKAIIAWDGTEEILILSTDAYAQSNTSVLEILPLPSNPEVDLGNFSSFYKIQDLIWSHSYLQDRNYKALEGGNESIEIVFQKKLGAHNITIIHIKSMQNFTNWINNFLAEKGASAEILPSELNSIISDYLQLEISYFVFDEIELTPSVWSIEPIIYRFSTDYLYFPLRISSIIHGDTTITLFCITDRNMEWESAESLGFDRKIEFDLNKTELSEIDQRIGEMFADDARLYVYEYSGSIQTFNNDLSVELASAISSESSSDWTLIAFIIVIYIVIGIGVIAIFLNYRRNLERKS